jgi:hypothetical protein
MRIANSAHTDQSSNDDRATEQSLVATVLTVVCADINGRLISLMVLGYC